MDAKSWIKRVSGEAPATVAKRLGMTPSTLDSQMKSANGLKPDTVVQIAREYGADVIASLVELGLITAKDVGVEINLAEVDHLAWLRDETKATDDILLTEIGRRLDERGSGRGVTPLKPRSPKRPPANVAVDEAARPKKPRN